MTYKFSLLVIDDELDAALTHGNAPRRPSYSLLEEHFEVVYLERISSLEKTLNDRRIDAALVDFVLDGWSTDISAVLSHLGDIPVGLISNSWGPNFEKLRLVLDKYNISRLFTWDDIVEADKLDVVAFWMESAIRRHQNLVSVLPDPDEPITILHLSDVQFGSELPHNFKSEMAQATQTIIRHWSSAPTFVAITGDVTETAKPSEFSLAAHWLRTLAGTLDPHWDDRRFLAIPGNHDVNWPLGWASRIDVGTKTLSKAKVTNPELKPYSRAPYREFSEYLLGTDLWPPQKYYWVDGRYRHDGLILFGYDTSEDQDDWCVPTQELVDDSMVELFQQVRHFKTLSPKALIVGLMHHPLEGDPKETLLNADAFKRNGADLGTIILLSGHAHGEENSLHSYQGTSVLQITASTVTKLQKNRPENTLRGFGMIELRRTSGVVTEIAVRSCKFEQHQMADTKLVEYIVDADGDWKQRRKKS